MRTSGREFAICAVAPAVPAARALLLLLGALFIAHLYWKPAILPGRPNAWRANLLANGVRA
jgi:hypothetical protein